MPPKKKNADVVGRETGKWLTNRADAGVLVRALHKGDLNLENTGPEVCSQFQALEAKWGSRKIRDNYKRICTNYKLWKDGKNRKYNVEILVPVA